MPTKTKTLGRALSSINFKANKIPLLVLFFLVLGIVIIADATSVHSEKVYSDPYRFVILQIVWIILGGIWFLFFYNVNYKKLIKPSYLMFLISMLFLGFTSFTGLFKIDNPFVPRINGAYRWLYLNPPPLPQLPFMGDISFQPSELVKLTLVLYLSAQFANLYKKGKGGYFTLFIVTTGIAVGLIMAQPNMSTAALVGGISFIIYFAVGTDLTRFLKFLPILMLVGIVFMFSSSYRRERVLTLIRGSSTTSTQQNSDYHIRQVLISLGSGGFWGVGFGQSRQKYEYLPEISSDSIFAVIGEEFGIVGTTFVLLLFGYFIYTGFSIAIACEDLFGRLLAVGITSWLALQFFINVGAMVGLLPLTGVPMPLISYGGSSMLFTLMGLGILANVEKNN